MAVAFLLNMGFSAVPTPLYVLYQQRDGISNLMVTVVFGVYAVGVIGSVFLGGHLSDWIGRRRVLVPALLANVLSAVVFIIDPSLAGLILARVISGVSVGLTTATATSYLAELHASARPSASQRPAEVVATGSNLGGIGFGPLAAGLLAQFAPAPLVLPYVVFGVALVGMAAAVALSPETVRRPDPRPRYRPQRVAVAAGARSLFYAATLAGLAAFAVFGVFNSLVPSFLAGTLHESSHAIAGAVPFAAFAGGAAAQILGARTPAPVLLRWSIPTVTLGLALTAAAMWSSSLAMFGIGGVIAGAGAGLVFKGSLAVAAPNRTARLGRRGTRRVLPRRLYRSLRPGRGTRSRNSVRTGPRRNARCRSAGGARNRRVRAGGHAAVRRARRVRPPHAPRRFDRRPGRLNGGALRP